VAFDVYVGTLTRLYGGRWENVGQRWAKEQGVEYSILRPDGDNSPSPPADEIRELVQDWQRSISAGLEKESVGPLQWSESDDRPYFTDRPGWDGYGGLLVWAAHAEHPDLPIPTYYPESFADDEAYFRSIDPDFKTRFATILLPNLWLPIEFPFVFEAPTITSDDPVGIGSIFTLKKQLDDLFNETSDRLQRLKAEPEPEPEARAKRGLFGGIFNRAAKVDDKKSRLADVADQGLTIFRDLAGKGCENGLPMALDF
jgi:hypothetical protein